MNQQVFRIALARKGIPQIALAKEIGIHPSTMNRYVKGWFQVPTEIQEKIAKTLGVSVETLFKLNHPVRRGEDS